LWPKGCVPSKSFVPVCPLGKVNRHCKANAGAIGHVPRNGEARERIDLTRVLEILEFCAVVSFELRGSSVEILSRVSFQKNIASRTISKPYRRPQGTGHFAKANLEPASR
jgi:hypothetical protein